MDIFAHYVNSMDLRRDAWFMSRPYLKESDSINKDKDYWDDVFSLDMSLQSMNPICLHLRTSMAFRELITTLRPHAVWAQTSRVTPFSEMEIPKYMEDFTDPDNIYQNLRYKYQAELHQLAELPTEQQDKNRLNLRACTLTEYYTMLDFRGWIKFLKYLEEYQSEYFLLYSHKILDAFGLLEEDFKKLNFSSYFSENRSIKAKDTLEEFGDFIFISAEVPFSLRAQLARHLYINLIDMLPYTEMKELESMKLSDPIQVNLLMKINDFTEIAKKRSCWLAQISLYEGLLKVYEIIRSRKIPDYNISEYETWFSIGIFIIVLFMWFLIIEKVL